MKTRIIKIVFVISFLLLFNNTSLFAEQGKATDSLTAKILQPVLTSWLPNVTCNGTSSCLNPNGSITIKGFLASWTIIEGFHNGAQGTIWLKGKVSYFGKDFSTTHQSVQPLMATFRFGKSKVIYSSFHTEEAPSKYFSPQEWVLQYLVFY